MVKGQWPPKKHCWSLKSFFCTCIRICEQLERMLQSALSSFNWNLFFCTCVRICEQLERMLQSALPSSNWKLAYYKLRPTFSRAQVQVAYRNHYSISQWYSMITLFLHLRSDVAHRGFEPRTSAMLSENSTTAPREHSDVTIDDSLTMRIYDTLRFL